MTPVEIAEYKQRWMSNRDFSVPFHSDYKRQAKEWCRVQLHPAQWKFAEWTNVYEHTMYFEFKQDSVAFQWYMEELAEKKLKLNQNNS